ncbi:MAG: hypothetical protein ACTHKG_14170 [Nocardioides sp.]
MSADRSSQARHQRRVVLHVGLPRSGTSFLQRSLAGNAEALGDRGLLYPAAPDTLMFRAALDVRGAPKAWGLRRKDVQGAWDKLAARARSHVGTTIVSQELLAGACTRQVDEALSMLKGLDVHVVVTAQDPARQLVSAWQDGVEHGRRLSFAEFAAAVHHGRGGLADQFHDVHDLPTVLGRWGRWLPAENVHVVTVPPAAAEPRLLWARFARAAGFDPDGYPPVGRRRADDSLGSDATDLLRRVNLALDGRLRQPDYGRLVGHRVAQELLAADTSRGPVTPGTLHDSLGQVGKLWVKELDRAGYVVHGDLADLVPGAPAAVDRHPDEVTPAAQVELAAEIVAELLLDLARAQKDAAAKDAKRRSWKRQARELAERVGAGS